MSRPRFAPSLLSHLPEMVPFFFLDAFDLLSLATFSQRFPMLTIRIRRHLARVGVLEDKYGSPLAAKFIIDGAHHLRSQMTTCYICRQVATQWI